MALPLWNSKTAHVTQLCLHPNDGVSLGICGSGYSSNINNFWAALHWKHCKTWDFLNNIALATRKTLDFLGIVQNCRYRFYFGRIYFFEITVTVTGKILWKFIM